MAVTMADITKLRKQTGAGLMDCKNALKDAEGDFDKALEILREKGQAIAAKRSDREASEGCVLAASNGGFAAIVALKCETDFVAKNADFVALTQKILDLAMANKPDSLDSLLNSKIDGETLSDVITAQSGVTGEKMELGYYEFIDEKDSTFYVHPGNMLASLVGFNMELDNQVKRDIAMQVAAMNPISLNPESVPAEVRDEEFKIGKEKARQEGKPEKILDRIAEGRLAKFFKENTLVKQAFIKEGKISVEEYIKGVNKDAEVTTFKRVTLNQE